MDGFCWNFRHPFMFIEWKHFWSDPNKKNTSCWNIFVYSSVYFQLYSSIWLIGSQLKCDDIVGTPVCLKKTVNFRTKAIKSRKTNHKNGRVRRRHETMCPRTNVLDLLVPTLIVPCDPLSLDWYIPHCISGGSRIQTYFSKIVFYTV